MDKNAQGPGLTVQVVGPGTPAEKAGIRVGDVIQSVNGKPVTSYASLESEDTVLSPAGADYVFAKTKPNRTVEIAVVRGGKEINLTATLTRHPLSVVKPENDDELSFLLTLQQIDKESIPLDVADKDIELDHELKGWRCAIRRGESCRASAIGSTSFSPKSWPSTIWKFSRPIAWRRSPKRRFPTPITRRITWNSRSRSSTAAKRPAKWPIASTVPTACPPKASGTPPK